MKKVKTLKKGKSTLIDMYKDAEQETEREMERLPLLGKGFGEMGREMMENMPRDSVRRKRKILQILEEMLAQTPPEDMKHSDYARYMRLIADLDGSIKNVKEEKHLHIHRENVDSLDEEQLRRRLKDIEEEKLSSRGVLDIPQAKAKKEE